MNTATGRQLTILIGVVTSLWSTPVWGILYSCTGIPAAFQNQPLTLVELSDLALSCHPDTRLAWAQSKSAWANLGILDSVFWPQVSGVVNYNGNSLRADDSTHYRKSTDVGISINFLVWDFGVSRSKAKAAKLQWYAAQFTQNYTLQKIILELEQTYYNLVGQQDVVVATKQSAKEAKANLDAAQARREQGIATIGDVYQAKSALLKAELDVLQAQGTLKVLEGKLLTNIGLPITVPIKVAPLPEKLSTHPIMESTSSLMAFASQNRPDILAARAELDASTAALQAAKRELWPNIKLSTLSQFLNGNSSSLDNTATSVNGHGFSNGITLSLTVPIFSGFSNNYHIHQAEAKKQAAESQYKALAQTIDLQVWQTYVDLQTASKSIESSRALLESATQAAEQARGQYESGVGDILTVLSTQSTASNARIQWIQAKLHWYTAIAQLSASLGNLIRER